jgi:drug/metabolite transporter (DMT)-like permease
MPLSALALVVLAGLIHASWNIAAKKAGGDVRFVAFTSVVLMLFWAPVGLWMGWQQVPAWGLLEWGLVLASALLHIVYFIVLLRGYRKADLTVVYPLARGSGPLLSSMVAIFFLGEQISSFGNIVRLVFLTPTLLSDRPAVWALWLQQRRYALVVGIFSPVSYVLVLYALQVAPLSHVAPAREVSMLFAALLGGHLLGEKDRGPRIAGAVLIAAGVMALGW